MQFVSKKIKSLFFSPPVADPIKFLLFANEDFLSFFAAKLGHFTISDFFLYVTKH